MRTEGVLIAVTRPGAASRRPEVRTVDLSELAKAEGAVTCCSIVFPEHPQIP